MLLGRGTKSWKRWNPALRHSSVGKCFSRGQQRWLWGLRRRPPKPDLVRWEEAVSGKVSQEMTCALSLECLLSLGHVLGLCIHSVFPLPIYSATSTFVTEGGTVRSITDALIVRAFYDHFRKACHCDLSGKQPWYLSVSFIFYVFTVWLFSSSLQVLFSQLDCESLKGRDLVFWVFMVFLFNSFW